MLSEIFFDAPHGKFHWFCGELLVVSIEYNFSILVTVANYVMHMPFILRNRLGPDSQLGQALTIDFLLWDFRGSPDGVYTSDACNDFMTALAVQCKETW